MVNGWPKYGLGESFQLKKVQLHPRFFAIPPSIYPIPDGFKFELIWYSQVAEWTLIHYRYSQPGYYQDSEILYQGDQLVYDSLFPGICPLYEEVSLEIVRSSSDPRSRISDSIGNLGVPSNVAIELRAIENRFYFKV
jgi:hypothetical protein